MLRASCISLAALLALLSAGPAAACTISSTAVAFGAYDPTSATADLGVGNINLDCRKNDTPVISLGRGSGTFAARRMSSGANTLNYNLFTTAARTIVWGDGTSGTVTVVPQAGASTPTRKAHSAVVYGRIPAGQNVKAGSYSDVVVITVTF